jgi:hypothetical protein
LGFPICAKTFRRASIAFVLSVDHILGDVSDPFRLRRKAAFYRRVYKKVVVASVGRALRRRLGGGRRIEPTRLSTDIPLRASSHDSIGTDERTGREARRFLAFDL